MKKNVFVFDITRHVGLPQSLISSAQAHAESFAPAVVEWFVSPAQSVPENSLVGRVHNFYEYEVAARLTSRIRELAADGLGDAVFHVYSHSGYVLSQAGALQSPSLVVSASPFKALGRRSFFSHSTPLGGPGMSVKEAIDLTKEVLAELGHTSEGTALKQLHLRPLLVGRDKRAVKNWSDQASVNLIKEVVNHGLASGWLRRSRTNDKSGTERIWLAQPYLAFVESVPGVDLTATQERLSEPVAVKVELPAMEAITPAQPSKGKLRTQEMVAVLKKAFIYSPSNIRRYAFTAIKELKESGIQTSTVAQFIRQVKDRALGESVKEQVVYAYWPTATEAILEMLLLSESLIGPNDKPIGRGLQARGTRLTGVSDDFEDKCELLLLRVLIQKMQLTSRDRTSIAHALFKEGKSGRTQDELLERLDQLFTLLGTEVSESDDGIIILDTGAQQSASVGTVH